MANANANDWSESYPTAGEVVALGAAEIRYLRTGVKQRLLKEHVTPAAANVGGEHRQGSAISYFGAYTGEGKAFPIYRPDGVTVFTSDDLGRLAFDTVTEQIYVLTAITPTWSVLSSGMAPVVYDGEESVTFPNGLIIKMGYAANTNSTVVVTFETPFPTGILTVAPGWRHSNATLDSPSINNLSATSFTLVFVNSGKTGAYWTAIGY